MLMKLPQNVRFDILISNLTGFAYTKCAQPDRAAALFVSFFSSFELPVTRKKKRKIERKKEVTRNIVTGESRLIYC